MVLIRIVAFIPVVKFLAAGKAFNDVHTFDRFISKTHIDYLWLGDRPCGRISATGHRSSDRNTPGADASQARKIYAL